MFTSWRTVPTFLKTSLAARWCGQAFQEIAAWIPFLYDGVVPLSGSLCYLYLVMSGLVYRETCEALLESDLWAWGCLYEICVPAFVKEIEWNFVKCWSLTKMDLSCFSLINWINETWEIFFPFYDAALISWYPGHVKSSGTKLWLILSTPATLLKGNMPWGSKGWLQW